MSEETHQRTFKGVWIPAEIWDNNDLSWLEKCLWAEINALGTDEKPCFASNAYLSKMLQSTEKNISNMISKMRLKKMIKFLSYDGRTRKIVAVIPPTTPPTAGVRLQLQVESDSTHRWNIDTKRVSKREEPPTPFGEAEGSAVASPSANDLFQNQLPTNPTIAGRSAMASRPNAIPEKLADFQTRANKLLARRDSTPWSAKEVAASKPHLNTPEEDWQLLAKYYAHRGQEGFYTRTSMLTLLNNWAGEIDKARAKFPAQQEIDWANVKPNM